MTYEVFISNDRYTLERIADTYHVCFLFIISLIIYVY